MKRPIYSLVILALFAATQIAGVSAKAYRGQESQQAPQITSARVKGKKLIVTGANFSEEAVIFVNGEPVATRSDPEDPGYLVAKKGGKRIAPETTASVMVQNNTGVVSQPFDVFSGLVITFENNGGSIELAVGEKFQLDLRKNDYDWTDPQFDPTLIAKLVSDPPTLGAQSLFQTRQAGTTQLLSVGSFPCAKSTPPCLAPSILFKVTLLIK